MPASPPRTPQPACRSARPGGVPTDLAAVWAVLTDMYAGYIAGDRERIDFLLDPDATVWDSATAELLCGKVELDRVRDSRPTSEAGPAEAGLTAYGQVVDVFGDLALARYWLRVDYHAAAPALVRNTAVLRRGGNDGQWLIVHLHEDVQSD